MDSLIKTIPTGGLAPDFALAELSGRQHRLADYLGGLLILNFWSAECTWCKRADLALHPMLETWGEGVRLVCVASNANEPPALLAQVQAERNLPVVLMDPGQVVADLYHAQITPHYFVIDASGILRYQGAFDDVTFRQRIPTRSYLIEAVQALLEGRSPDPAETPAYGCTLVREGLD